MIVSQFVPVIPVTNPNLHPNHVMFTVRLVVAAAIALLMSAAGSLEAQGEKPPPPPVPSSADLGFVSVAGNTTTTTLAMDEKYIRRMKKWEFRQELGAVYGKTDGVESSNLWRALLRADYVLFANIALLSRERRMTGTGSPASIRVQGKGSAWRGG